MGYSAGESEMNQSTAIPDSTTLPASANVVPARLVAAYAATLFLSAFLLFQVQLIVSKYILPWFGGSAAVWTTSMLVFPRFCSPATSILIWFPCASRPAASFGCISHCSQSPRWQSSHSRFDGPQPSPPVFSGDRQAVPALCGMSPWSS